MDRNQAWDILCEFTKSDSLRRHALAVEACVVAYALNFGEDAATWGITALLHDFDWEVHPQAPDHPMRGAPILAERGVPEGSAGPFCRTQTTAACREFHGSKRLCLHAMNWRDSSPQ